MIVYKEGDVRKEVRTKLKENLNSFYKDGILNYEGYTADSKNELTEVIADELIENYDQLRKIGRYSLIRRTKSFNRNHNGVANVTARLQKFGSLGYSEKLFAIALYNSKQGYCLGDIFDYEVPINETHADKYGRIDLVSTDALTQSVKLIELKIKPNNNNGETLLRALLEIFTYYKLISNSYDKFLKDYNLSSNKYLRFQPAILTEQQALSGQTLLYLDKYPRIQALMSMMNNEIDNKLEGYVYDYPCRNKPFQSNGEDKQKVMLQGEIRITKII